MYKIKLYSLLPFFILLLLASCTEPKPFEFKGLKSIQIEKASFGKNIFNAKFDYYNPNSFTLSLVNLDCDVFVNDNFFTHYTLDTTYPIAAKANFELPAKMEVSLSSLLGNTFDLLLNKPMKITIKGQASVSKGIFTKKVPIEFTTMQRLNLAEVLKNR